MIQDLVNAAHSVADGVDDLVREVEALKDLNPEEYAIALHVREALLAASAALLAARQELDTAFGRQLGPDAVLIDGHKVRRHPRLSKRNADNAALLRAVLDTVLVDMQTGEMVTETPLDKVKAVWPLDVHSARSGVLKQRQIDLDEFCETEFRGYNLEVR